MSLSNPFCIVYTGHQTIKWKVRIHLHCKDSKTLLHAGTLINYSVEGCSCNNIPEAVADLEGLAQPLLSCHLRKHKRMYVLIT